MSFEDFIIHHLELAGVSKEHRKPIFLENKEKFIRAFTHKSFNPYDFKNIYAINRILLPYGIKVADSSELAKFPSYETMEFKGDLYLKTVHGKILADRYPVSGAMDQQRLTFAFQRLISEKVYSNEAERLGFFQYILMSDKVQQQALLWKEGKIDQLDNAFLVKYWRKGAREAIYKKLLEDTLESFACALVESVDAYTKSIFGPGMAMLYRWGMPLLDNLSFDPTNLAETKAKGMVLKELWEDIYSNKFEFAKLKNEDMFIMNKVPGKPIQIFAIDPITKDVIARTSGLTEKEARAKAAEIAVAWLLKWKSKEIEAGKNAKKEYKKTHGLV